MALLAQQIDILMSGFPEAAGGTAEFYAAGTSTAKPAWPDKDKDGASFTSVSLTATYGRAIAFGDGYYKVVIKDSTGTEIFPLGSVIDGVGYGVDMSVVNDAESYPAPATTNQWKMTVKHDSSDVISELGISNGTSTTVILPNQLTLDDISSATGYQTTTPKITFNATDIDPERDFDMPTDGTTDASAALVNAWTAYEALSYPGVFKFPPRCRIRLDTATTLAFTKENKANMIVDGNGCSIIHNVSSASEAALKFTGPGATKAIRNVTIQNFDIGGSGSLALATCFEINGQLDWFQGWKIENISIRDCYGQGVYINNAFEIILDSVHCRVGTANIAYSAIKLQSITTALGNDKISSLSMNNCITSGGRIGCEMLEVKDASIDNGTHISAYYNGMHVTNAAAFTGNLSNMHFESNDTSGAGTKGLLINNMWGGTLKDIQGSYEIGLAENSNAYSCVTVIGGYNASANPAGTFTGTGGVVIIGQNNITNSFASGIRVTEVTNAYVKTSVDKHKIQTFTATSVTPILTDGSEIRCSANALGSALTINAPTTGPANNPTVLEGGEEISFYMAQDSVGGRTITWNATYKNPPTPAYTADTYNTFTFRYIESYWRCVASKVDQPL